MVLLAWIKSWESFKLILHFLRHSVFLINYEYHNFTEQLTDLPLLMCGVCMTHKYQEIQLDYKSSWLELFFIHGKFTPELWKMFQRNLFKSGWVTLAKSHFDLKARRPQQNGIFILLPRAWERHIQNSWRSGYNKEGVTRILIQSSAVFCSSWRTHFKVTPERKPKILLGIIKCLALRSCKHSFWRNSL